MKINVILYSHDITKRFLLAENFDHVSIFFSQIFEKFGEEGNVKQIIKLVQPK